MPSTRPFALPLTAALLIVALVAGCAAREERPEAALAAADASISSAENAGARQFGAQELDDARQKLTLARKAADDREEVTARRLAEQAAVDAEFAGARGQTGQARESLSQLEDSTRDLKTELDRQRQMHRQELDTRFGVSTGTAPAAAPPVTTPPGPMP